MDQSINKPLDAIIIGGGPSGSTAAAYLAKAGHSVLVLEKEKFPREHVGESLLPFCYRIFEELGVLETLRERFVRKPGVRFIDIDGSSHTTWCFGHVIKDESYLSFHVIRAEFDQLLLENARELGADVREEMTVKSVNLEEPDGLVRVTAVNRVGETETFQAKFLLDASGQQTFLARRFGWKKPHQDLDRIALSTHWTGAKFIEGIEEGLLQIVYLGGDKKGWIWVIPVRRDRLSVGLVLNNSYVRREKARLTEAGEANWQEALYRQELASSPFVKDILENAAIAQPLMANGNYSYFVEQKYGDNFAMIGDAASFIDPIFASGVFLGMNSARSVSGALSRKLTAGNEDGRRALEDAYGQINGAYRSIDKLIRLFYNPKSINFAQMGAASGLIYEQHQTAMALAHYLLAGDFFEKHEKYNDFIDLLQNPEMVEKYKTLVLDQRDLQGTSSCGAKQFEVFAASLK